MSNKGISMDRQRLNSDPQRRYDDASIVADAAPDGEAPPIYSRPREPSQPIDDTEAAGDSETAGSAVGSAIARPTRPPDAPALFDIEPDWRKEWWGMPSFEMGDARPQHKVTINFMTPQDVAEFAKVTGLPVTPRSDTAWFPRQQLLNGSIYYDGPKTDSRYPVCIPSKGRADCQTTAKALKRMGVSYRFFVEETEYEDYCLHVGLSNVVKLPFHDLGQGSIPARNFIWDWARQLGYRRHWVVDDNIACFTRMTNNRRLIVKGGGFFRAMEDFVDRYDNIAMAGPHDQGFVKDRGDVRWPYLLNSRVYSCILLDSLLPHRWRGRYNEDTDLSLRLLKDGYCTLLFHALLMSKNTTVGVRNSSPMPGGNTDNVYAADPTRRAFAESLREQHPDVVEVVWKFNRWHHQVDYSPFRRNRLRPREGVTPTKSINDYGMTLVRSDKASPVPSPPVPSPGVGEGSPAVVAPGTRAARQAPQ